jgi:hypothetical protein
MEDAVDGSLFLSPFIKYEYACFVLDTTKLTDKLKLHEQNETSNLDVLLINYFLKYDDKLYRKTLNYYIY